MKIIAAAVLLAVWDQTALLVSGQQPAPRTVDTSSIPEKRYELYAVSDSGFVTDVATGEFDMDALVADIETTYAAPAGCIGFGQLVAISNEAENHVVDQLCGSGEEGLNSVCTIGYVATDGSDPSTFAWLTGESSIYENWGAPSFDASRRCVMMLYSDWYTTPCGSSGQTNYVVEYNCPAAPAFDDDWNVAFHDATARFDDTSTTDPELLVRYNGSAPDANIKYYVQTVFLAPDCANSTTDGAVYPALGRLPDAAYNAESGLITTKVDINTDVIEGSVDFWTRTSPTTGTIDFCLRMDLLNENHNSMAVETTRITLSVDTTTGFEVMGVNYTNELQTSTEQDVRVDYPINVFFCDDNNLEVTPAPTLFPGDVLQVCVKTDSNDATVTDVRSLAFKNALVAGLALEVINAAGDETNGQTLKVCDATAGICNIKSVTFSSLYQYDTNNDGVLEDVASGATMDGVAVLNFGAPGSRRFLAEHHQRRLAPVTGFDIDLSGNLEQLPADPDAEDSSTNRNAGVATKGGIGAGIAILAAVVALAVSRRRRGTSEIAAGEVVSEPEPTKTPNGSMGMI